MKKWLKKWGAGLILLLFAAVCIWFTWTEQRDCALCDSRPYHGLCLVDLQTGRVYELTVYDPNPYVPGTLQDLQSTGTMSPLDLDDLYGWRYCGDSAYVSIPAGNRRFLRDFFCGDCRKLVQKHQQAGYVIADLLDTAKPKVYPIVDGASYTARCYEVTVTEDPERGELAVTVRGTLDLTGRLFPNIEVTYP